MWDAETRSQELTEIARSARTAKESKLGPPQAARSIWIFGNLWQFWQSLGCVAISALAENFTQPGILGKKRPIVSV